MNERETFAKLQSRNLRDDDDVIHRQAAEMLLDLQSPQVSPERVAEWLRWKSAETAHGIAFATVEGTWNGLGNLNPGMAPTDSECDEDAYDGSVSVTAWLRNPHPAADDLPRDSTLAGAAPTGSELSEKPLQTIGRHYRWAVGAFLAAVACALLVAALGLFRLAAKAGSDTTVVETRAGETRRVVLRDGSEITVSGASLLWVAMQPYSRSVSLERGEAFFHVAKDSSRPFTVRTGSTEVTAVGTAFNVRKADDRVVIDVSEGVVKIATAETEANGSSQPPQIHLSRLAAGQQLSVARTGSGVPTLPQSIDARTVAGWREGRLSYVDEPLGSVVDDLQRYTKRDIEITDPAIAQLRVTGSLLQAELDGWLKSLETSFPVQVVRTDSDGIRLQPLPSREK